MTQIKSEIQTYTPIRGMIICENGSGDYILKTEADECLAKELEVLKEKAEEATCKTTCGQTKHKCSDPKCSLIETFIQKLNEK